MKEIESELLSDSYQGLAEIIGVDNMLKIRQSYGGTQLQLPMRLYDAKKLQKKLKAMNVKPDQVMELSRKYGYSPRWIKQAIK